VSASKSDPSDLPRCVVIGRKPPKGYREVSAMHLGHGMWAISCEKDLDYVEPVKRKRKSNPAAPAATKGE